MRRTPPRTYARRCRRGGALLLRFGLGRACSARRHKLEHVQAQLLWTAIARAAVRTRAIRAQAVGVALDGRSEVDRASQDPGQLGTSSQPERGRGAP